MALIFVGAVTADGNGQPLCQHGEQTDDLNRFFAFHELAPVPGSELLPIHRSCPPPVRPEQINARGKDGQPNVELLVPVLPADAARQKTRCQNPQRVRCLQ